jgi:hypothetical protein
MILNRMGVIGFMFLMFFIGSVQAKVIQIECDLKMTTSDNWISMESDKAVEFWTYDDQLGLSSKQVRYPKSSCNLGDEELVCERYVNPDKANSKKGIYQKTYLNRYNLLLKDYLELEDLDMKISSRIREGTCVLQN